MDDVCRVCQLWSKDMLNIFDGTLESGVSIANIVAQYTGFEIKRGDSFPETICSLCLQDARNGSRRAQSFDQIKEDEENYQVATTDLSQLKKEYPDPGDDLLEEQVCEVTDSESEGSSIKEDRNFHLDFQVKQEKPDNEIIPEINPQFDAIVKSEPIEEDLVEDSFFEDQIEESNNDQYFDIEVKEEQPEDEDNDCPRLLYECSFCQQSFNFRKALMEHSVVHTGERPSKCPQCEKTFRTRTDMKNHHLIYHVGGRTYNCTQCPATFPLKELRREHSRIHKKPKESFNCPHCSKVLRSESTLASHTKSHSGYRPFVCSQCSNTFRNSTALKNHMFTHSGKTFPCLQCPKTFKHIETFKKHRKHHRQQEENANFNHLS